MIKKERNKTLSGFHIPFFLYMVIVISFIPTTSTNSSYAEDKPLRKLKIPELSTGQESIISWQSKVRHELSQRLSLPDSRPLSFDVKQIKKEENPKWKLEEIEAQSTSHRQMYICLATPSHEEANKYPAIVCIHGHGGNRYTAFEKEPSPYHEFGKILVQNGFVVITTDIGQHEVYEKDRTLMGERLWDLMRCVDYLETLPFVDKNRIGCTGLSLGGEMAMWLGAMDTRIQAVVVCGFLTYMDQMEKNHCLCWKFEGLRELVDFPDIYGLIPPRALQCQNGEKEPPDQFPPSLAQKAWAEIIPLYKVFNAEEKAELVIHHGGHEIAVEPMLKFFKRNL
ncbi:MAG: alpha/beta hydrolase family protein [Candidatus Hydrogenedens sp.]